MADKPQISELVVLRERGDGKDGAASVGRSKSPIKRPQLDRALTAANKRIAPESLDELLKRKPGPLLDLAALGPLLKDRGIELLHHHQPATPLVLSPKVAHVEGRGWLNFFLARSVFGENGQAWFVRTEEGEDYRKVEVWLTGLTRGASYLVQLRVTAHPSTAFEVRGSDTAGVQTVPAGYQLTIPVLVHDVDYSMSLVTVANHADAMWGFYDATISAL